VASVPRGRHCGCICPSCSTPLVARQGKQKEWHFAHRSRGVHEETQRKCEYSFLLSVRLMIRQLSMNGLRFRTPGLSDEIEVASDSSSRSLRFEFVVTKESVIELESPRVGVPFSGVEVDVLGNVKNIPFAIFCTYHGRDIPAPLSRPQIERSGVVELNLDEVAYRFKQDKNGRYVDTLQSYIEDSTDGKNWIYHPRYTFAKSQAMTKASQWLSDRNASLGNDLRPVDPAAFQSDLYSSNPPEQVSRHYKCVLCGSHWHGTSRECSQCKTHLYTTERV
jgi:hypothetical protein